MPETDFIKPSNQRPVFILGVAGGSGSGKTYFAQSLVSELQKHGGPSFAQIIYQDNFYIDQSSRFDRDGGAVNFDHPDSIDFPLLAKCLQCIKNNETVQIPIYDFATHKRKSEELTVKPCRVVIVDGILIFHEAQVRELFDDLIFFQTPEELRFQRRLERDVKERGRTPEGVRAQFLKQVKPMHDLYVEPSLRYAQTVVQDLGDFATVLQQYSRRMLDLNQNK
jgi:uridine kinase